MSIVIYSKPNCTYCVQAKDLLRKCSMEFEEKMFGKDFMSLKNYTRQLVNKLEPCLR